MYCINSKLIRVIYEFNFCKVYIHFWLSVYVWTSSVENTVLGYQLNLIEVCFTIQITNIISYNYVYRDINDS